MAPSATSRAALAAALLGALGCGLVRGVGGGVVRHVTREIPPPGGCDQCHRLRISSRWEVALAPAALGREGGIPEDRDVVLRELRAVPYHGEVPERRLAVLAAAAPPETFGTGETGIQCFVCHRSPGPPHEQLRGTFPHPWGKEGPRP